MDTVLSHAADMLSRALKHLHAAHHNLSRAAAYAGRNGLRNLHEGTLERARSISKVTRDVETLDGVIRARASAEQGSGPEIPPPSNR
jgi:hypothetical protein